MGGRSCFITSGAFGHGLLRIMGELAVGGSVAVAVGISNRGQVTDDRWQVTGNRRHVTWNKWHLTLLVPCCVLPPPLTRAVRADWGCRRRSCPRRARSRAAGSAGWSGCWRWCRRGRWPPAPRTPRPWPGSPAGPATPAPSQTSHVARDIWQDRSSLSQERHFDDTHITSLLFSTLTTLTCSPHEALEPTEPWRRPPARRRLGLYWCDSRRHWGRLSNFTDVTLVGTDRFSSAAGDRRRRLQRRQGEKSRGKGGEIGGWFVACKAYWWGCSQSDLQSSPPKG